jgi:formylglycine-generating enzyme required for sulfatase activity
LLGDADGFKGVAPVESFPAGASPYGVLNLSGNVQEWTSSPSGSAENGWLVVVRGGDWTTDPREEYETIAYETAREPRFFSFDLGFRCVAAP